MNPKPIETAPKDGTPIWATMKMTNHPWFDVIATVIHFRDGKWYNGVIPAVGTPIDWIEISANVEAP